MLSKGEIAKKELSWIKGLPHLEIAIKRLRMEVIRSMTLINMYINFQLTS